MANNIIMFWDRINVLGDPLAGIEALSNPAIAVPANACGFRLCLPRRHRRERPGARLSERRVPVPDAAGGLRHLNGGTRPRLSWAVGARSPC